MTNDNGIKVPDVPDDSNPKLVIKFCSGIHAVTERLLREYKTQGKDLEDLKQSVKPNGPAPGVWEEINNLKAKQGAVTPAFLWTVMAGLFAVIMTVLALYLTPLYNSVEQVNNKLFEAEKYHQLQQPQDDAINKLEGRIRALEEKE